MIHLPDQFATDRPTGPSHTNDGVFHQESRTRAVDLRQFSAEDSASAQAGTAQHGTWLESESTAWKLLLTWEVGQVSCDTSPPTE